MRLDRVVPNLTVTALGESVQQHAAVLGLRPVMDHGWIVTLADDAGHQVSIMTRDDSAPVNPDVSVFVDDVHDALARAECAGVEIVHPRTEESWGAVVLIGILALMQLEGHFLQPLIMSRNVEIHPLAVVFSALIGATMFGVAGALLAVPVVAFAHAAANAWQSAAPAAVVVAGRLGEPPLEPTEPANPAREPVNAAKDVTPVTHQRSTHHKTGSRQPKTDASR